MSAASSRFYQLHRLVSHHWLTLAFVAGFITDLLLLDKIDDAFDNAILLLYVVLATVSLVLFYVSVAERGPAWLVRSLGWGTPIVMQYAFGGLLSGMLIFYGRSGDLIASAPFLLLIAGVIIANELVKKRSERLLYNVSLYFIGLFSYTVLVVPVWSGKTGDGVFIVSGLVAVAFTMLLIKLLKFIIPNYVTIQKRLIVFTIGCLYALFNAFYFLNIIPPIPLSLTELEIFHQVTRLPNGQYQITKEERRWYESIPWYPLTVHAGPGQSLYCYARVYAPTDISTTIQHRWAKQTANGTWEERSPISYPISGGNDAGYRGFTIVSNVSPGKWRCSVENGRGQVLGRQTFTVVTSIAPTLVTVVE